MSRKQSTSPMLLIGAAIGVPLWLYLSTAQPPAPSPFTPTPTVDLRQAFSTNNDRRQAKVHAHQMGTLLKSLAGVIRYDADRRDSKGNPAPRLQNGVQIDDLRLNLRELRMQGWSYAQTYPGLGPAIHQHLSKSVGTEGDIIDEAKRRAWISSLEELAAACEVAAQ